MNKPSTISNKRDIVLEKAEDYAHAVYGICRGLPKYEQFGLTSQLRRAALSIPLNVVEGFARQSKKSEAQFLTIAYGSLKEAQFILIFATKEGYITEEDVKPIYKLGNQAARLIWSKTQTLRNQLQHET